MRKHRIKLNKSRKQNSGKTWEAPQYLFLENIEYDISDVQQQEIYIILDFIKYEIKFDIRDRKLYSSLLNQLYYVFDKLNYNDDLKNTIEELERISHEDIFDVELNEVPNNDGTIETKRYVKLNIEYGKKLADIKSTLNKILYQMPIYFCYHTFASGNSILTIDRNNTVEAINNSKWGRQYYDESKKNRKMPLTRKQKEYVELAKNKIQEHSRTLKHWEEKLKEDDNWYHKDKVKFFKKLIKDYEYKIQDITGE